MPLIACKIPMVMGEQRLKLTKYENEYKRLKVVKHEFYSHGASKEDRAKGLKLPPSGMILKTNVPMYIDGDEEIIELQGKIDETQILVDELEKMVNYLAFRSKTLEAILALRKFEAGA